MLTIINIALCQIFNIPATCMCWLWKLHINYIRWIINTLACGFMSCQSWSANQSAWWGKITWNKRDCKKSSVQGSYTHQVAYKWIFFILRALLLRPTACIPGPFHVHINTWISIENIIFWSGPIGMKLSHTDMHTVHTQLCNWHIVTHTHTHRPTEHPMRVPVFMTPSMRNHGNLLQVQVFHINNKQKTRSTQVVKYYK